MRFTTVFLDRDGVINRRPGAGWVRRWEEFEFLPGVVDAIARLKRAGTQVAVFTNQSGVARGIMTANALAEVHRRMLGELEDAGAGVDAVYHCPHFDGDCECRKPKPGMLLAAERDLAGVDFARAVVVGDSLRDLQAGHAVGCAGILVGATPDREAIEADARREGIALIGVWDSLAQAVERTILRSTKSAG